MPNNQISDLITDQEIAFALLILSGTMTDRQAAGPSNPTPTPPPTPKPNPVSSPTCSSTRPPCSNGWCSKKTEEVRRQNQSRERVLARLWEIANLDPEMTRNSMSAQIKALSMIVAIEGLIPETNNRRAGSKQQEKAIHPEPSPAHLAAASIVQQEDETGLAEAEAEPAPEHDLRSATDPPSKSAFAASSETAPYCPAARFCSRYQSPNPYKTKPLYPAPLSVVANPQNGKKRSNFIEFYKNLEEIMNVMKGLHPGDTRSGQPPISSPKAGGGGSTHRGAPRGARYLAFFARYRVRS